MQKSFTKIAVLVCATLALLALFPTPLSTRVNELGGASIAGTAIRFAAHTILPRASEPIGGEENDRINILFLGVPGRGNDAPYLTDSIIVVSIKPSTKQIALTSLPRDLLVRVESRGGFTKINSLFFANELDPSLLIQKMEEITGVPIHYYFVLDISGVEKIIDAIGGLNVFVPHDIYDTTFPTKDHGTETFTMQKGWRYFDGTTVQKYLRTRHGKGGDFARMEQQQAVLEALRKRLFGLHLLYDFPTVRALYQMVTRHSQTDIGSGAMARLYDIVKEISYGNVIQKVVNGDPKNENALLKSDTALLNEKPAFVLVPKAGDFEYTEIWKYVRNVFN